MSDSLRWDSDELKGRSSEWITVVTQSLIDRLIGLDPSLNRENIDLFKFKEAAEFIRLSNWLQDTVYRKFGVAVLKCGPQLSDDQARFAQLAFSSEFGDNVTSTPFADHRPLFALEVKPDPTCNGRYQGSGLKNDRIGFHTDGSGSPDRDVTVVSMLCVRAARFGGQCRLSNSLAVYERLPNAVRDVLYRSFRRVDPDNPQRLPEDLVSKPIYKHEYDDPCLTFSYHPRFLRQELVRSNGITEEVEWAFSVLEKYLEDGCCEINLMPHEILFINNRVIAHDRREFWDESNSSRLLERFWAGSYAQSAVSHTLKG